VFRYGSFITPSALFCTTTSARKSGPSSLADTPSPSPRLISTTPSRGPSLHELTTTRFDDSLRMLCDLVNSHGLPCSSPPRFPNPQSAFIRSPDSLPAPPSIMSRARLRTPRHFVFDRASPCVDSLQYSVEHKVLVEAFLFPVHAAATSDKITLR